MRVDLLTREYPPETYGRAGEHVAELVRAMRSTVDVRVRCFGADRVDSGVDAYQVPQNLTEANPALAAMGVDLEIASATAGADVVHSHTWYANLAGHLASLLHGIPHVMTTHSLEPLRPWKAEQLGGGYRVASWIEQTAMSNAHAIIAISAGMAQDIRRCYPFLDGDKIRVIPRGVDPTSWHPVDEPDTVRSLGVDPNRPSIIFVEPATRQTNLSYLLRAAQTLPAEVQLVLCAGAGEPPAAREESRAEAAMLQEGTCSVVWVEHAPSRMELRALLSSATALVCPSAGDVLGGVHLEAMACSVPVVAAASEDMSGFVDGGVTGVIVPIEQERAGTGIPLNPDAFIRDLAEALNQLVSDPARARTMGAAGRARVEQEFTWQRIGAKTVEVYQSLR